jgi:eukaryotic-like serine/threonine-protein kinase
VSTLGYAGLQPQDPREIGPYKLLGQLGMGGMGQVFLGMSAGGRPIAVKVIRAELASDPDFRARFEREVAAAQRVSGLFTALVVDADLTGPTPWLATAYVAGPSLTETVRGHGPLAVHSLWALAAGLAEGLSAIHAAGVVHRDLKPSNVLLAEDGPRIIDFGISGAAEASAATGASVMIGSPGYMSPEQVLGRHIGPAGDMFSLGAVLTFAATGQAPFGHGSSAALMYRLVNNPANIDGVPGDLRPLVGHCLAKDPGDRPSAGQLLAALGAIQPAPGWLAESIMNSFAQTQSAAAPAEVAELVAPTGAPAAPASSGAAAPSGSLPDGEPLPVGSWSRLAGGQRAGPAGPGRRGRHRISRPLASACLTGCLVAGSAVVAITLIGADRTSADSNVQPRSAATSPATATAPATSPAAPGASPSAPASLSPSSYFSPVTFTGTTLAPTPASSTPVQPGSSGSTKPSTSSPSVPPSSAPPSSAPPSSAPPSSAPPSSDPPSSAPPSSAPPSSDSPSSAPPSSAPPSSAPPSSAPPSSDTPSSAPPSSDSPSSDTPTSDPPSATAASGPVFTVSA